MRRDSHKLDLAIAPGVALELFSFPEPPARVSRPEACGLRHLAFGTPTFERTLDELARRGVAIEAVRRDETTGRRFTFFADPDGLPIEVYEAPAAPPDGGGFAARNEVHNVNDRIN